MGRFVRRPVSEVESGQCANSTPPAISNGPAHKKKKTGGVPCDLVRPLQPAHGTRDRPIAHLIIVNLLVYCLAAWRSALVSMPSV
jgi:hypothetical protein